MSYLKILKGIHLKNVAVKINETNFNENKNTLSKSKRSTKLPKFMMRYKFIILCDREKKF